MLKIDMHTHIIPEKLPALRISSATGLHLPRTPHALPRQNDQRQGVFREIASIAGIPWNTVEGVRTVYYSSAGLSAPSVPQLFSY